MDFKLEMRSRRLVFNGLELSQRSWKQGLVAVKTAGDPISLKNEFQVAADASRFQLQQELDEKKGTHVRSSVFQKSQSSIAAKPISQLVEWRMLAQPSQILLAGGIASDRLIH
jgi:hypothetical protein